METSGVFLPLFAEDIGASKFQIGVIGSAYGIAYAVSALVFSRQADRGGGVLLVRIGLGTVALVFFTQSLATSPLFLTLARASIGLCLGVTSAALMVHNFAGGRSTGQFASFGAMGWLIGSVVAIFLHDYQLLFVLGAAACALAFILSLRLKEQEVRPVVRLKTLQVIRRNIRVYLAFLLRQFGANMVWVIFPLFLTTLGADKSAIAILAVINTTVQIIAMIFVEKIRESRLFVLGLVFSALVFLGYALATNYLQVIPIQILLAVGWAFLYVGALLLLLRHNEARATSTGVLFSSINLSASLGSLLGGYVAQVLGYQPLMYFALGFCVIGAIVGWTRVK